MSESSPPEELLFDTNAASALIRQLPDLLAAVDAQSPVLLPLAVAGELLYGARHAANPAPQLARVRALIASSRVVLPTIETAERYGSLKAELRRAGKMIPENDLWIAATALEHSLRLVTADTHFDSVEGLGIINWQRK